MANSHDGIRDVILRYLHGLRGKARGMKSIEEGLKEIQRGLKDKGIKQADLVANLDYLVQKDWVKEVRHERSFTTPRGTVRQSEQVKYKISDIGIDLLEGASAYHREESFSRINISNVNGVTVVGTGNIVNSQYTDLAKELLALERAVVSSPDLTEENKLNSVADIGVIQSQLARPEPDKGLVGTAWRKVEQFVTAAGFVEAAAKVGGLIGKLIQ
jgi:hypothetical protein